MATPKHPESISVEVNSETHESCTVPTDSVSIPSDNCLNRYELPPRSTRDVPPKRYDPEYEDQRSKYPIERINNENLSNTTIVEGAKATNREQYQKIVGKPIYLAHTRPDIAYTVGVVSRFMHLPQIHHMTAVMRIPRYLKGTISTGIYFGKNDSLDIIAYTDADWAGDRDGRKSTFGYFTLVGGNLVTWRR
uniref:Mitochondrial protein n=1 Tax=Chenopodium quinoa TaxID=63459 RepID=A0A803L1U3_CHEQI